MWDFTAGELIAPASNIFDAVRYRRFVAIKLTFAAKCKCSLTQRLVAQGCSQLVKTAHINGFELLWVDLSSYPITLSNYE